MLSLKNYITTVIILVQGEYKECKRFSFSSFRFTGLFIYSHLLHWNMYNI